MRSQSHRDSLAILLLPFLGIACCVGLPLLLSAGAGAAVWILGAGAPLVFAIVLAGLVAQWRRRRRASGTRGQGRPAGEASAHPLAAEAGRGATPTTWRRGPSR